MIKPIYLDYNGTTPHDPEVIEAMRPFLETEFGNPSSSHWYGIKPKQAVETARRQVAGILNCRATEVFFTSGGTESNNHAIRGVARRFRENGNPARPGRIGTRCRRERPYRKRSMNYWEWRRSMRSTITFRISSKRTSHARIRC